uniref:BED-type domain-containing protein n=1 Tax=Davidia involucrata TaxID=16924 RepID=A0A5B6YQP7_DAVIN
MEEHSDEQDFEQSSTTSKRFKRTTSIVWDKFEKLPINVDGRQKAMCKMCKHEYVADSKSGTSNLLRHLTTCPKRECDDPMAQCFFQIDQDTYREKLSEAIIRHNYPFAFVEHEAIRDLHSYLNPNVKFITRNTAKSDVLKRHKREKEKLRHIIESIPSRICLTSDLWSSLPTNGYLALTAHYVDENWILQKKILNFRHVPPSHNGPILAEKVINLLKEWGIEKKIFTLTLDNAKYNDGLVEVLKSHLSLTDTLFCGGEFFHVRCGAHILNLIVQDGLKVIDEAVFKIRESVKYVRGSEGRKIKFSECITLMSLKCSKKVRQDVPTRWNYTYLMLESALIYRRAFFQLQLIDTNFKTCPSEEEWVKVERIAKFLKPFHDITTLFSGSHYPTANLYFHGV